jgi:hypothetical protein
LNSATWPAASIWPRSQRASLSICQILIPDGSSSQSWASVSDFGGIAEINADCGAGNFATPFCTYPWHAFNSAA